MPTPSEVCGLCGGKAEDHGEGKTHHKFTLGDQLEPLEKKKAAPLENQPPNRSTPADADTVARLVKVLHRRGAISDGDVLEILGFRFEVKPLYRDPSMEG